MNTKKPLIKSEENLEKLCLNLCFLCKFLDNVYKINAGGCCYVAAIIAKLLEKDEVDFSVIVYNCDYDDFYDIDCSQYHYTLRIGEYIINNDGYEECPYSEYPNTYSIDLSDHYNECEWNTWYDTNRNKRIKRIIKDFYNDFTYDLREG